ncbi:MAG TPA: hypothetical protein VMU61_11360 [Candidatus Aquilonibacter sp.]|nr:hypothetical protein [Candidatus Aquilonibacter sp.]
MPSTSVRELGAWFFACFLASSCLLAASPLGAQQPSPSPGLPEPPGASLVLIARHAGYVNEPSIAINPNHPEQLVAAFQTQASAAYSRDVGKTWTIAEGTSPPDYKISGDVSVTFDNQGHAFLCYIAFDKLGTENYWAHNATRNGIFVRRSGDGGITWDKTASAVIAQKTEPGIPFEDKPYIVADNTHSRFAGNLYVGWTEFSLAKSVILFSRSIDGGVTWSPPIKISTHEGLPRDDTGAVEGFTGTVGADGTLYVAWADGSEIAFASSRDGGRTFSRSHTIVKTAPSYFTLADVYRANGFPQIGIDPRSNRLFLTWSDYRNGDLDVFCSTSTSRGKHWSAAVRVNSDALHDGADQFFQWMAVDPVDGSANVVFYDRRSDPANRDCSFVLARSTDGGRTFTNYDWTPKPFDPNDAFIGDYSGVAAYGGHVYGIWGRLARPDEIAGIPASPPAQAPETAEEPAETSEKEQGKAAPTEKSKPQTQTRKPLQIVEVGIAEFSRP